MLPTRTAQPSTLVSHCWVFFFSSRRRHTRYWRDWSSDVCSSDLLVSAVDKGPLPTAETSAFAASGSGFSNGLKFASNAKCAGAIVRSEERRVGKECRDRLTLHQ